MMQRVAQLAMLLLVSFAVLFAPSAFANDSGSINGVVYHWGDPPHFLHGNQTWTELDFASEKWLPWKPGIQDKTRSGDVLWLAFRMPEIPVDPVFLFSHMSGVFEIFARGERLVSWGVAVGPDAGRQPGWKGTKFLLPIDAQLGAGDWVRIRFVTALEGVGFYSSPRVLSRGDAILHIIKQDLERGISSLIALVLGLVQILIFVSYGRPARSYLGSGLFSLAIGVHLLVTTGFPGLMGIGDKAWMLMDTSSLYFVPATASLLVLLAYSPKPRWLFRTLPAFSGVVAVVALLLYGVGWVQPYLLHRPVQLLLLTYCVLLIGALVVAGRSGRTDAWLLVAGFLAPVLSAVYEIFRIHNLLFGDERHVSHFGFLFFVIAPAIILLRRFVLAQRTLEITVCERDLAATRLATVLDMTRTMGLETVPVLACVSAAQTILREFQCPEVCLHLALARPETDSGGAVSERLPELATHSSYRLTQTSDELLGVTEWTPTMEQRIRARTGELLIPIWHDSRWLGEMQIVGVLRDEFAAEDYDFLEAISQSLATTIEKLRLAEIEKFHLRQIVTLAAHISDRVNSPLTVIINGLAGLRLRLTATANANSTAASEQPSSPELKWLRIVDDAAHSLTEVSAELSQLRNLVDFEATRAITER